MQMVHTHTPAAALWLKWKWTWDGNDHEMANYPTGTWDGERKRGREKRRTPTPTHLAQNGQTLKGQGKRKSGRTTGQTKTRGGGWTEALDTIYKARAKPTSAREGPKPDLTREHAWDRGPMGGTSQWKDAPINQCKVSRSGSKALQF